ncbi:hypothetical protein C8J56DRAFT_1161872 [Mycena floridula]|nr:hypothetical protein C8J56DRAFT_1161872 [Mycena floridula]
MAGYLLVSFHLCDSVSQCNRAVSVFLRETLRSIVGDGSLIPPFIYRSFIPIFLTKGPVGPLMTKPPRRPFQNPLLIFGQLDVLICLILPSIPFMVHSTFFTISNPVVIEEDITISKRNQLGSLLHSYWPQHDHRERNNRKASR